MHYTPNKPTLMTTKGALHTRYPEYTFIGDEAVAKTAGTGRSLGGIIRDIHLLSLADYLVCTFSSQVIEATKLHKEIFLH